VRQVILTIVLIVLFMPVVLMATDVGGIGANEVPHLARRHETRSLNAQQGKIESIFLDVDGEVLTSLYLNRLD